MKLALTVKSPVPKATAFAAPFAEGVVFWIRPKSMPRYARKAAAISGRITKGAVGLQLGAILLEVSRRTGKPTDELGKEFDAAIRLSEMERVQALFEMGITTEQLISMGKTTLTPEATAANAAIDLEWRELAAHELIESVTGWEDVATKDDGTPQPWNAEQARVVVGAKGQEVAGNPFAEVYRRSDFDGWEPSVSAGLAEREYPALADACYAWISACSESLVEESAAEAEAEKNA